MPTSDELNPAEGFNSAEPEAATTNVSDQEETQLSMLKTALNVLAMDIGLSVVLGFILGFSAGFIYGDGLQMSTFETGGIILGVLVSIYAGYILHRRFGGDQMTLAYLCILAAILLTMSFMVPSEDGMTTQYQVFVFLATILAYVVGWTLSKKAGLNIFIPGKVWLAIAKYLGYIMIFFVFLGVLGQLLT